MRVILNGVQKEVQAETLQALLVEGEFNADLVATALNSVFVHRRHRASTVLHDGDRVEILSPIEGG